MSLLYLDLWAPLFESYVRMHVQVCARAFSNDTFFARFFLWNVCLGDSGGIRLPNYILCSNTPAVTLNTPNT